MTLTELLLTINVTLMAVMLVFMFCCATRPCVESKESVSDKPTPNPRLIKENEQFAQYTALDDGNPF